MVDAGAAADLPPRHSATAARAAAITATAQGRASRPRGGRGRAAEAEDVPESPRPASCSPTSCAVCQRASGSFARHPRTIRSSAGGDIGWTDETGGGSPERIAEIRPAWLEASKAFRPVAISYRVAPRAKMSDRASAARPSSCSGGHVGEGADDRPIARDVRRRGVLRGQALGSLARRLGEAEVQQFHARLRQHHVGGFQIAMNDALAVRGGERSADLRPRLRDLARRHRPARQALRERLPVEQLHDGVGDPPSLSEIVKRQDVGMRQRRDRARLALEPRQRRRVHRDLLRQHLDRDLAPQPRVLRLVDLPHAARADAARESRRRRVGCRRRASWLLGVRRPVRHESRRSARRRCPSCSRENVCRRERSRTRPRPAVP